ncbi:hypothetical protein Fcan01_11109 [Folsomia candida]|uniref:Uncharacterized protein n=1 Tax=Folsomia candida TaxID=158441 RepID=A0A226EBC0_FOLCA|nr:hypothetical protein Fcan01_11109 [Folsomia candida]
MASQVYRRPYCQVSFVHSHTPYASLVIPLPHPSQQRQAEPSGEDGFAGPSAQEDQHHGGTLPGQHSWVYGGPMICTGCDRGRGKWGVLGPGYGFQLRQWPAVRGHSPPNNLPLSSPACRRHPRLDTNTTPRNPSMCHCHSFSYLGYGNGPNGVLDYLPNTPLYWEDTMVYLPNHCRGDKDKIRLNSVISISYSFLIFNFNRLPAPVSPLDVGHVLVVSGKCVCPHGFGLWEQNATCIPCPLEEVNERVTTPDGGMIIDNLGKCICPIDHKYILRNGYCQPICVVDDDCPDDKFCYAKNSTCITPCLMDVCPTTAHCTAIRHAAICRCPEGTKGYPTPDEGCVRPTLPRLDFPSPNMRVNCLADGVQVDIDIHKTEPYATFGEFNGFLYVEGFSEDPNCRKSDPPLDDRPVDFKVKFGTCGTKLKDYQQHNTIRGFDFCFGPGKRKFSRPGKIEPLKKKGPPLDEEVPTDRMRGSRRSYKNEKPHPLGVLPWASKFFSRPFMAMESKPSRVKRNNLTPKKYLTTPPGAKGGGPIDPMIECIHPIN